MSLQVEFHPLAALEVTDAERWYDRQRPGLGDRYLAAVNAAVNRAAQWPNAGTPVEFADDGVVSIRKVATAGFPHTIGYEVNEGTLTILAVFHQQRRPNYWTGRSR